MLKRLIIIFVLLLALSGCASTPFQEAFNADHPGEISWGGGSLQLLFSNPDYADAQRDALVRQQILEDQLFGRGTQNVTGGVGMMGVWRF